MLHWFLRVFFFCRLNYALKKLADDKTTKDYNIERGSVLHLVLALSGGVDVLWIVTLSYFCLGILFFLWLKSDAIWIWCFAISVGLESVYQ